MAINQKVFKAINKIFDAGFSSEKDIAGMAMDDILAILGITIAEMALKNDLQKCIKTNKVISFLNNNNESKQSKVKENIGTVRGINE